MLLAVKTVISYKTQSYPYFMDIAPKYNKQDNSGKRKIHLLLSSSYTLYNHSKKKIQFQGFEQ